MSSTPWMEVGCIGLMLVAFWGEIQCSCGGTGLHRQTHLILCSVLEGKYKLMFQIYVQTTAK